MPWVYSNTGPVSVAEIVGVGVVAIGGIILAGVALLLIIRVIKFAFTGDARF